MPWDDGLDLGSPAYQVAASEHKRIRVLAGPGSGKSFAMKRRVARLLEVAEVDPQEVLAITFTRVGAEDLHRELLSLRVKGADSLQGRTLHSVALSILMRNRVLETLGRTVRPLNEFEMEPLLEDLSSAHGTKWERRRLIAAYVAAWSRLQQDEPGYTRTAAEQAFVDDLISWLKLHEAMLIGEVIPALLQYLRTNPGAPERTEFTHVLVDEFQDLNRAEQEVIALLGENASTIIIGDDDQSIYSFKHAHPEGIRGWAKQNSAEEHEIAECRRCPFTIVRMANALIAKNSNRSIRAMTERAANGAGQVIIRQYATSQDETNAIAAKIKSLVDGGVMPAEIIVLAQREVFATPIYKALKEAGVPAKSYYAESELDNIVAQERFALLKLLLNNEDRVALRWLLGCFHKKWHAPAYTHIISHLRATSESPWETLSTLRSGNLKISKTGAVVKRFAEIVDELEKLVESSKDLDAFIEKWLPKNSDTQLLRDAVDRCKNGCSDLEELLEALELSIVQPEIPLDVAEVRIMSLHKSKGLSSPYVFIVGCVEGLLPGQPKKETPPNEALGKLEEDRRLFYVGITRVKANPEQGQVGFLALTYPKEMLVRDAMRSQIQPVRTNFGKAELQPSRFISEMAPHAPKAQFNVPI